MLEKRSSIKSGDLLIWKKSKFSKFSNFYLNLIRFFTRSEFAHVAIAWRLDGRLFVVEATQPLLRVSPIKSIDEFYHIPMNVNWDSRSEAWLIDKVGLKYSIMDGLRAYLGITVENDSRYQCAELANEFYKEHGILLGKAYTPSLIVSAALEKTNTSLSYFTNK